MTRQEFLDELREALQGDISQARINENVNYYNNYIIEESRKGRTEDEVIAALGSPRLIAKSISEASQASFSQDVEYEDVREDRQQEGFHAKYEEDKGWDIRYGRFKLNSWYGLALVILIAVLILLLIGSLMAVLLPVLLPVILVSVIIFGIWSMRR